MTFLERIASFTARLAKGTFTPRPIPQELYVLFANLLRIDFQLRVAQMKGDTSTAWELMPQLGSAFRELQKHGIHAATVNEAFQQLSQKETK